MRKLPHDFQRDLHTYHLFVKFRNAVEAMRLRRGHGDPDEMWWGFGPYRRMPFEPGDDGLAGSRVPRRPFGGAGSGAVALDEPWTLEDDAEGEARPIATPSGGDQAVIGPAD